MNFSETCVCVLFVIAIASAWNKRDDDDEGRSWKRTLAKQCRSVRKECYREMRGQQLGRVCGTDNKTYKNICLMMKASCEKRKTIDVEFEGTCKRKKTASKRTDTDSESDSSEQSRFQFCLGIRLQCPRHLLRGQVCGTNGRTYPSDCELERAKCNGALIERAYRGPCYRVRTDPTTTTTRAPTTPSCNRRCTQGGRIVCGTDGVTYLSECHLRTIACFLGRNIDVLYYEPCRRRGGGGGSTGGGATGGNYPAPATTVRMPITRRTTTTMSTTAMTSTAPATTVPPPTTTVIPTAHFPDINPADDPTEGGPCPNSCPDNEWDPVCGTDGKTYETMCHLRFEACNPSTPDVSVEYMGECVEDVHCGTCTAMTYDPVCGTDGITYYNKCELERYACFSNTPTIQLSHRGACVGEPSSGCPTNCPEPDDHEVCGTDGNTYPSLCHLTRRCCLHDSTLALLHPGPCRVVTIDPCKRNCQFTYSPVCGSDGKTYFNGCFFDVARCKDSKLQGSPGSCGLRIS